MAYVVLGPIVQGADARHEWATQVNDNCEFLKHWKLEFAAAGDQDKRLLMGSIVFTPPSGQNTSGDIAVAFNPPFGSIPMVVATPSINTLVAVRTWLRTQTGCVLDAWRTDGTNFSGGVVAVCWIAIG